MQQCREESQLVPIRADEQSPKISDDERDEDDREAAEVAAERQGTKLFVDNLDYETSPADLRRFAEPIGGVVHVTVPLDYQTGRNRGYAFFEMASVEDAKRARQELEGTELRGRRIRLEWAKS
jgi:heterogeneous nuclear ribonucleoprotein A1/A3